MLLYGIHIYADTSHTCTVYCILHIHCNASTMNLEARFLLILKEDVCNTTGNWHVAIINSS